MEPSWRLPKYSNQGVPRNPRYEPQTAKPDTVSGISVNIMTPTEDNVEGRRDFMIRILNKIPNSHRLIEIPIPSIFNLNERMPGQYFSAVVIIGIIIEYKKDSQPKSVRQLAMTMTTSLRHQLGLKMEDPTVFGFLIEGKTATLHVGWVTNGQVSFIYRPICYRCLMDI